VPIDPEYQQLLIERRMAEERAASSETRRAFFGTLARLAFWVLVGMAWIGASLHTEDEGWGWIFWWLGWLLWVGGVLWTLHGAYRRGVDRGDWG
jgi:hypothetical protein